VPRLRRFGAAHPLRRDETNYCARCQTGGRLLADRAMSRLLREDRPRSIDEVE
jgi:formamidopyrimidine-DNA glycosylase